MSDLPARLSDLIRPARLALEPPMTQEALAAALGVSQPSVSAWEKGHCLPALPTLVQLCDLLGLDLAEALETLKTPA